MSHPHESLPVNPTHDAQPVADYELNEAERKVVDSFKDNTVLLLQGETNDSVHIHQNHAYSLAQETVRETIVSELGDLLKADLDTALLSTENEVDITIGTYDRQQLNLGERSGTTRATVRQIDMPANGNTYRLREIEFPVMVTPEAAEPYQRWNRIISAFKLAVPELVEPVVLTA